MERKMECEIVQDLLFNYVDGVLNEKSKKLVEDHLSKCDICQNRLKEIKSDITKSEENSKREIDYLKKIRRKSKIKAVIMAIGIIILVCFLLYLREFLLVQNFMGKAEKTLQTNNFYKETREIMSDNKVSVGKTYYKDGKYKSVWEIYSDNGKELIRTQYAFKDGDEIIEINENEKKVTIEKGNYVKLLNRERNLKNVPFVLSAQDNLIAKLGMAFYMSIHTDTRQIGREYYVLRNRFENDQMWEIWIDKENGLPLKEINRNAVRTYLPGTDIVKEERDMVQEYKYKFDKVTDDDVKVPDFTGYEINYINFANLEELM